MALEYPFELPATLFHSIGMPIDTQIDESVLENFGKALMIVAGADNRISIWERGWLSAYMSAYGASRFLLDRLDDFDYKNANLDDYLTPLLESPLKRWVRRALLQGAIRMSRADDLAPEEYEALHQLSDRMQINRNVVREIRSLVEAFDSVASTNTLLLTIAQKEDAEEHAGIQSSSPSTSWDEPETATIYSGLPHDDLLTASMNTFAQALLYVAGADGEVGQAEWDYLIVYLRSWGATEELIQSVRELDVRGLTPEQIVAQTGMHWGLKALTSVALRMAGADGLHPKEENALLELYQLTDQSHMQYYAIKGLEEVRAMTLARLNEIYSEYLDD